MFGPYTKIINMVVHHTGNGIGVWTPALEAEVYGNLIYEVGWDDEDRGHGHSIYIQNDELTKRVVDNVLFDGRSYGVHAFTHGGQINNLYFEGNIAFDHGSRAKASGPKANFLVGGRQLAKRPTLAVELRLLSVAERWTERRCRLHQRVCRRPHSRQLPGRRRGRSPHQMQ